MERKDTAKSRASLEIYHFSFFVNSLCTSKHHAAWSPPDVSLSESIRGGKLSQGTLIQRIQPALEKLSATVLFSRATFPIRMRRLRENLQHPLILARTLGYGMEGFLASRREILLVEDLHLSIACHPLL